MKRLWHIILIAPILAQEISNHTTYSIYTTANSFANYNIKSIESDVIRANDGSRDIIISINEIERIVLPGESSMFGKIIGGGVGGYCGAVVGFIPGFMIWVSMGGSTGPGGPSGTIIFVTAALGATAGLIGGSKVGGNLLGSKPQVIADFRTWTLEEKKDFIRTNLIK